MATNLQTYRTSTGVDTIPSSVNNHLANGTVTTSPSDSTILVYTGTDNLSVILNPTEFGLEGDLWLFVPGITQPIGHILGVTNTNTTTANTYAIQMDRAMTGASGSNVYWVRGDLKSWSCLNQGSDNGVFAGLTLAAGVPLNQNIQYNYKQNTLDVQYFDATGTSYLIGENK